MGRFGHRAGRRGPDRRPSGTGAAQALVDLVAAAAGYDVFRPVAPAGVEPLPVRVVLAEAQPEPIRSAVVDDVADPVPVLAAIEGPTVAVTPSAEHAEVWELVRRAQTGDGEAFGRLYDRYVDTVFRYIYFRVNDRALAEDFTSETFLRALRRIASISYQGRDIGAWFVTIARNIVFDHSKSARYRLEVSTPDLIDSERGEDHAPSPELAMLDSFTATALMAAIAQLNAEQRECVTLRFLQGFSVSETAAAMGKNDGTIKALQHRAIRKLAVILGDSLR